MASLRIIHPKDTGANNAPVSVGSSFVAYGTANTADTKTSRTKVTIDRSQQPLVFHRPHGWFAYFKNLRNGKCTITVKDGKNGNTITRDCKVNHAVRGLTTIQGITVESIVVPSTDDPFCPESFYAYGLLDEGSNFIVSAEMKPSSEGSSPASFIFTDPDTGFWVAIFDRLASTDPYTLTVITDNNVTTQVSGLTSDINQC